MELFTTIIVRGAMVAIVSISVHLRVHSLSLWAGRPSVVVVGRAVWLVALVGIGSLSLRGTIVGIVHLWLAVGVWGVGMIVPWTRLPAHRSSSLVSQIVTSVVEVCGPR